MDPTYFVNQLCYMNQIFFFLESDLIPHSDTCPESEALYRSDTDPDSESLHKSDTVPESDMLYHFNQ